MMEKSLNIILEYGGNGLLTLYFLASLIYILLTEKEKGIRRIMAEYPLLVLCIFFIPITPWLVCVVAGEEETFYRFLWLIPMTAVSSYATVKFLGAVRYKWLGFVLGAVAAACIAIGGNPCYKSPVFVKAENAYQLPQDVVDICDAIVLPGREVEAVFPHELVPYVRQYTPLVMMPYGYETMVTRWNFTDELAEEMIKDTSVTKNLTKIAREKGCHYIVLNKAHFIDEPLENYDYMLYYETDNYIVYQDAHNIPNPC